MTTPAPGWYHAEGDPPNTERYWDGASWTDGPRPVGGFPAAPSPPASSGQFASGPYAGTGMYTESSQSTTALVLSIVGIFCCLTAPIGTYLGWAEMKAIDDGRRDPSKRGVAVAAMIIGIAVMVIAALIFLFIVGIAGLSA